jgi:hypothetical protein
VWSLLPAYSGPTLRVARRVEVADHVVPGLVVLAVAGVALVLSRRRAGPAMLVMLGAGLTVLLAGFWMTATHVPLLRDAARDQAPVDAALYHSAPGLAVLALGLLWAVTYWRADEA